MRYFAVLPVLLTVLLTAAVVHAQTCSGLINYVEPGSIYGIRMKGIDKGHTLTITKIDKEHCVLAATTGKGDIILIDANSVSMLTRQ